MPECSNTYAMRDGKCAALSEYVVLSHAFAEENFSGIDGWTIKGNSNGLVTSRCGSASLVGGFNVFGSGATASKEFVVPAHYRLRLKVQFFKIDAWNDEYLYIDVDGRRVWQ